MNWVEKKEFSNIIKQFDVNIKIESISPEIIAIRYDVNTVKQVPVVLHSEVKFSSGFDLTEAFKLVPDSVKVIGPKVLIDSILEIVTEKLVLENINSDVNSIVQLKLPIQNHDIKFSDKKVQVFGAVEKFTEGTIEVPINVINVPKNVKINYYPKVVPVIYYTSLSNFKTISSSSFIVECDFSSLNVQDTYLIPKVVQQPQLVKNARLNIKRIEFILIE